MIALAFLGLLSILLVTMQTTLMNHFNTIEIGWINDSVRRTLFMMDNESDTLRTIACLWAHNEEIYRYFEDPSNGSAIADLETQSFNEQNFNIIALMDDEGEVLYSRSYDSELQEEISFPPELSSRLSLFDALLGVSGAHIGRQGIIATSQGPLVLAVCGVVGKDVKRAENGVVVMGLLLDDSQVYHLEKDLPYQIRFDPVVPILPADDQKAMQSLKAVGEIYSSPVDDVTLAGYSLIEDYNGQVVYLLRIEQPRTLHQNSKFVSNYLMISMIIAAIVLGGTFFFSLDRLVLNRVTRLGKEIQHIAESSDLTKRVSVTRRDELSRLTITINQMLAAFEKNNAELQVLSRQLVAIQETERRQIALELHDEIGQYLTGLKLLLEGSDQLAEPARAQRLQQASKLVNELIGRVRELSLDLRPAMLDDFGLVPALLWLFERYESQTRVQVLFQNRLPEGERYDPEVETAAFRTVQEALTNIARHAQTDEAEVTLWRSERMMEIKVEDRGVGFDLEKALDEQRSSGLIGMRERVGLLDGRLNIETAPGKGTSLTISFPLAGERSETDEHHHFAGG